MSERSGRTAAEWVTLAIATAVLAIVVGLAVSRVGHDDPAHPVASVRGPAEQRGADWILTVDVHNDGDITAADVQVVLTATFAGGAPGGGEVVDGEQVVDFLAGGDDELLEFVFDRDPAAAEIDVRVASFSRP